MFSFYVIISLISEALLQSERMRGTNIFFSDHVDVALGSPKGMQSIATYGLGGCSALVVEFDSPRAVVLGHFQTWKMRQLGDHRKPLLRLLSTASKRTQAIDGLLLHPGDIDESALTGVREWPNSNADRIEGLTLLIKEGVSNDIPVISAGYLEIGRGDDWQNIEQGSVIIDLPNETEQPQTRVGVRG